MRLDDPNHDPSDPLVCKPDELMTTKMPLLRLREMIKQRIESGQYAAFEAGMLRAGITDQLKIRREYEAWKEGE